MTQLNTAIQNLLVIDSQVTDWQSLAAGAGADTTVLILDSAADGLTQITDYLSNANIQGLSLLQSIQIISHGSAGSLQLGSSTITKSNIGLYAKQLAKIGSSLTDTGDILLYGCNVAAGQVGLDFINQLSVLTNADIAASNDITGSAALNGNWQLEANTGTIESVLTLNNPILNNYTATLAINTPPQLPVITPSNNNGSLSAADAINPFIAGSYFDTYTPTGFVNGTAMSLALSSTAFDTYLQVMRNGIVFALNDDNIGSTNSLINYTYQTGDTIYATSSGGLVTGAYSLNITGTIIPAFEVLTTLEDTPITITTPMLPVTDLEQTADQLTYTLATLPLKGSLSKAGVTLIAGNTFTQADVDNGLILLTPNANANGTDSFTFSVADGLGGALANQTFAINITPVNDAPALTVFAAPVASSNEDNQVPVTFSDLLSQGNEADVDEDGTVTAFVIKAVSTGSLKIGASVDTATDWSAYYNNVIDPTHLAYWTPDANANGILNAFTAVAEDNSGFESVTPVQTTISVVEVPDVTVIAALIPIEGGVAGAFKINLDSPAPTGGLTINYSLSGTASLNTDYTVAAGTNITAVTAGSFTIAEGQTTARLMLNAGNDGIADPNETVTLNLMTVTGYQFNYAAAFDKEVAFAYGTNQLYTVGDFNGDGKQDLAVANYYSNTVSVLLRNPANNGFDPKVDFATDRYPSSVSVGDFNGDGKTDLAIAYTSETVSVLLRNSTNTGFDPSTTIDFSHSTLPSSFSIGHCNVGDFNGDGKADLVVQGSNTVSVLLRNTANTGFDPKVDVATGYSVSVGDFNGDGKTDLAIANTGSNTISVLLRNGTNTGFDPKVDVATGSSPKSVSVGDFNGDGKADLAALGSNTVSVLLRNPANNGFDPKVDVATGSYTSLSAGDFNGDGTTDLSIVNQYMNNQPMIHLDWYTLSVLLRNVTNSGFDPKIDIAAGSYTSPISVNAGYVSVNAGDVNGDGKYDLYIANGYSASMLLSSTLLPATLTITDHNPSNIAPTLTTFTSTVASGNEDSQITITFANIQAQGNEADVDGTVTAFVIKAVSTGTLLIGASAGSATAWDAATNNTVDASNQVFWTPDLNANGILNAFTAVAKDNGGFESTTPIQTTIKVIEMNDLPSGSVTITGRPIQYQTLIASNNLADIEGLGTITYQWLANGDTILGATESSFILVQNQVGKTITVQASYTDGQGTLERVTSSTTNLVKIPDAIAPTVTSFNPVDGATAVAITSNIDLIFSEAIQKGTGFITLHAGSAGGAVVESFDAATSNQLVFSGSSLTIDPLANLANNTQYFVTFDAGTVKDIAGNNYTGTSTYDFTTAVAANVTNGTVGNDKLVGTNASDSINGGKGADSMKGGLGSDIYFVDNKGDVVIENKGAGTDTVYSSISFILGPNVENLTLTGKTAINGTGNALNNTLIGNSAANKLSGLTGNDILNGGLGKDSLTGGVGKDVFDFNSILEIGKKTKGDLITDFSHKQDKINLFDIDANTSNGVGNDAFKYIGEKAFTGKAGELHFIKGILSGDTNGDKVADFDLSITVVGGTSMVIQDFVL